MNLGNNLTKNSNKGRCLFFTLILFILIPFSIFQSACEEGDVYSGGDWTVQNITVNSNAAKTEFTIGEEFNFEGLNVSAFFSKGSKNFNNYESETRELTEDDFKVDAFNFNSQEIGEYVIFVTYNWENKYMCESYYIVKVVQG